MRNAAGALVPKCTPTLAAKPHAVKHYRPRLFAPPSRLTSPAPKQLSAHGGLSRVSVWACGVSSSAGSQQAKRGPFPFFGGRPRVCSCDSHRTSLSLEFGVLVSFGPLPPSWDKTGKQPHWVVCYLNIILISSTKSEMPNGGARFTDETDVQQW